MKLADLFFEQFDMLPVEYRRMLDYQTRAPTLADIKAAWELLAEDSSMADLINRVNKRFYPEKIIEQKKREREEYAKRKAAEKDALYNKRMSRYSGTESYQRVSYRNPNYIDPANATKNDRLVMRVKAETAYDAVVKKEAKLVNTTDKYINRLEYVATKSRAQLEAEKRAKENAKAGYDMYAPPNKKDYPKAETMKRLDNSF